MELLVIALVTTGLAGLAGGVWVAAMFLCFWYFITIVYVAAHFIVKYW